MGSTILNFVNNKHDQSLQNFREGIANRLNSLKQTYTDPPFGYLAANKNMDIIYRESISCYLLGTPNSCLPSIVKVLEISLREKYEAVEGKSSDGMELVRLIEWSKEFEDKNTAHSFRMLRNYIHENISIKLQDCVEAIRHISIVINKLHDQEPKKFATVCPSCNTTTSQSLGTRRYYVGDDFTMTCSQCKKKFRWATMIGFEA